MEKIRKEYSQEDKLAHIAQWLSTGKTKVNYCKEMDIAYTTFRHWLDKYHYKKEKKASLTKPSTDGSSSFLAIQIQPSSMVTESSKPIMELVFNNGARLNFYHAVSADYLQQLLTLR